MVSRGFVKASFDEQQQAFAELAGSLTDAQWASPSLCSAWTVHQVVVHTAWHIRLPTIPVRETIAFYRLGEERSNARLQEENASRPAASLVEWLAGPARCNTANLCELIIHQQDVRRPLGLNRAIPPSVLTWILDFAMSPYGNLQTGGKPRDRAKGLRLVADDLGWTHGEGAEVHGPAEAILMTMTGRSAALPELTGPGTAALAERASVS